MLILAQIERIFWARPLPVALLATILGGIMLLSWYLYRRPWGLPLWLRLSLAFSRMVVLALVVATLLEPTAVINESKTALRSLPVLIDRSASMSMTDQRKDATDLADAAVALGLITPDDAEDATLTLGTDQRQKIADASRFDLATSLLTGPLQSIFAPLEESLDFSYHSFGEIPRLVTKNQTLSKDDLDGVKADASSTSIMTSLESVTNSGGIPPAGIILLSDGIENNASRESESILRDLGARKIPVYTIPIGLSKPDDVSIRSIVMQEVAFSGDRVPVRVQIRSEGYERRSARLSIKLNGRSVSQKTIRLTGGLQFEDIDFRVDLYEKGAAAISISIEPFDDEISRTNNQVERSIRVVNEKINVLYIEGNARWEYRYLHAILKRDPRIKATFINSSVGPEIARNSPEHIERFPSKRKKAFQYDLVILGDVDAAFFSPEELTLLEELIRDRGGSLLMLCGPMHSPLSYANTSVETMLPIRFDSEEGWEDVPATVYPVLTPEGRNSMVMTLENERSENDQIWSRAAPLDQLPPLLEAKQGATILASLSDRNTGSQRYPLVAWQRYGTGKCLSIASDRLWRLRFKTGDKYHWRVWSQCIQFLTLSRLMGEHKRIRLETDRSIYPLGEQCRLYAHVLDSEFEPMVQQSFDVIVTDVDNPSLKQTVTLRPDQSHPGLFEGYFSPASAGRYRVEANEDDAEVSNSTEFQVAEVRRELNEANMQRESLKRISELTGGKTLTISDLSKLPSLLNQDPVTLNLKSERPLWDHSLIAILLIALLGAEWILRRKHDLP